MLRRGKKLNLDVIYGCKAKQIKLLVYCENRNIDLDKVLCVGNDINDLKAMKAVGFSVAPADAHKEILKFTGFILIQRVGKGSSRDCWSLLLIQV